MINNNGKKKKKEMKKDFWKTCKLNEMNEIEI